MVSVTSSVFLDQGKKKFGIRKKSEKNQEILY